MYLGEEDLGWEIRGSGARGVTRDSECEDAIPQIKAVRGDCADCSDGGRADVSFRGAEAGCICEFGGGVCCARGDGGGFEGCFEVAGGDYRFAREVFAGGFTEAEGRCVLGDGGVREGCVVEGKD